MNLIKQYKLKVKVDLYNHDEHEYDRHLIVYVVSSDDEMSGREKELLAEMVSSAESRKGDITFSGWIREEEVIEEIYTFI